MLYILFKGTPKTSIFNTKIVIIRILRASQTALVSLWGPEPAALRLRKGAARLKRKGRDYRLFTVDCSAVAPQGNHEGSLATGEKIIQSAEQLQNFPYQCRPPAELGQGNPLLMYSAEIFSQRTNKTQEARVYSPDGPIRRRKRGYILTTDPSDAGSAGIFSRWTNRGSVDASLAARRCTIQQGVELKVTTACIGFVCRICARWRSCATQSPFVSSRTVRKVKATTAVRLTRLTAARAAPRRRRRAESAAVDAKGYCVDAKGYCVDAKGYCVDVKGYCVD
eukprot:9504095-Pyramimonas_sp.AAC.1